MSRPEEEEEEISGRRSNSKKKKKKKKSTLWISGRIPDHHPQPGTGFGGRVGSRGSHYPVVAAYFPQVCTLKIPGPFSASSPIERPKKGR